VENPILQETKFSGVFRPRPLGGIAFSFSQCTSSYYELLHQGSAIVDSPTGVVVKTPLSRMTANYNYRPALYVERVEIDVSLVRLELNKIKTLP
jgi:hypothetical protein